MEVYILARMLILLLVMEDMLPLLIILLTDLVELFIPMIMIIYYCAKKLVHITKGMHVVNVLFIIYQLLLLTTVLLEQAIHYMVVYFFTVIMLQ